MYAGNKCVSIRKSHIRALALINTNVILINMIENTVFLLIGLPFLACELGIFFYFFKMRREVRDAPWFVNFFHLYTFDASYLTDKGKQYRNRYWMAFVGSLIFGVLIVFFMIWVVPN
jgi:hypothetical protein